MSEHERFIASIVEFCERGSGDAAIVCGNRRRLVQIGEGVKSIVRAGELSASGRVLSVPEGRRLWLTTLGRLDVIFEVQPSRVFLDPSAAELNPAGTEKATRALARRGLLQDEAT